MILVNMSFQKRNNETQLKLKINVKICNFIFYVAKVNVRINITVIIHFDDFTGISQG